MLGGVAAVGVGVAMVGASGGGVSAEERAAATPFRCNLAREGGLPVTLGRKDTVLTTPDEPRTSPQSMTSIGDVVRGVTGVQDRGRPARPT